MQKTIEVLKKLVKACDLFWMEDGQEDNFEHAKEDAKAHLKELENYGKFSWDAQVYVIATRAESNKVYDGRLFYDKDHATNMCKAINERHQTGNFWKVFPAIININKRNL